MQNSENPSCQSPDLHSKYQKLAQEYAKLRAQNSVLRKAVVDEQANQNGLKDQLRDKDSALRKCEQEIESLNFRNHQLEKRVEVLLEETDHSKSKKSAKGKDQNAVDDLSVINEELQNKILENEKLHKQIEEASITTSKTFSSLESKISQLERERVLYQEVIEEANNKWKALVDQLKEEKKALQDQISKHSQNSVSSGTTENGVRTSQCSKAQTTIPPQPTDPNNHQPRNIDDGSTGSAQINEIDMLLDIEEFQRKMREEIGQGMKLVSDIVSSLANWLTYAQHRARIFPFISESEPMSPVQTKFCKLLSNHMTHLPPVEEAFRSVEKSILECAYKPETACTKAFIGTVMVFISYLFELLPYFIQSLEEENMQSWCSTTLVSRNVELESSLTKLEDDLTQLTSNLQHITTHKQTECVGCVFSTTDKSIFTHLAEHADSVHRTMKDLSKHFYAKVNLEHQLPIVLDKVKSINTHIITSLMSLVSVTGSIASYLRCNIEFFDKVASYSQYTQSHLNSMLQADANAGCYPTLKMAATTESTAKVMQPSADSRSISSIADDTSEIMNLRISEEELRKQLSSSVDKILHLEQEREHWMLECQLCEIKYERETKKLSQLGNEVRQLKGLSLDNNSPISPKSNRSSTLSNVDYSILGTLETEEGLNGQEKSRETAIRSHYTSRVAELIQDMQLADSKAVNFYIECQCLRRKFALNEQVTHMLNEELKQMKSRSSQMKDELDTTSRNYERQLSTMSDHICLMNDQLTSQKDEIEEMKLTQKAAGSRRGKPK